MRPYLEFYIELRNSQHKKDIELLYLIQRRAMKIIRVLEHLYYENRLRELGFVSLEKRNVWIGLPILTQRRTTGKMDRDSLSVIVVIG